MHAGRVIADLWSSERRASRTRRSGVRARAAPANTDFGSATVSDAVGALGATQNNQIFQGSWPSVSSFSTTSFDGGVLSCGACIRVGTQPTFTAPDASEGALALPVVASFSGPLLAAGNWSAAALTLRIGQLAPARDSPAAALRTADFLPDASATNPTLVAFAWYGAAPLATYSACFNWNGTQPDPNFEITYSYDYDAASLVTPPNRWRLHTPMNADMLQSSYSVTVSPFISAVVVAVDTVAQTVDVLLNDPSATPDAAGTVATQGNDLAAGPVVKRAFLQGTFLSNQFAVSTTAADYGGAANAAVVAALFKPGTFVAAVDASGAPVHPPAPGVYVVAVSANVITLSSTFFSSIAPTAPTRLAPQIRLSLTHGASVAYTLYNSEIYLNAGACFAPGDDGGADELAYFCVLSVNQTDNSIVLDRPFLGASAPDRATVLTDPRAVVCADSAAARASTDASDAAPNITDAVFTPAALPTPDACTPATLASVTVTLSQPLPALQPDAAGLLFCSAQRALTTSTLQITLPCVAVAVSDSDTTLTYSATVSAPTDAFIVNSFAVNHNTLYCEVSAAGAVGADEGPIPLSNLPLPPPAPGTFSVCYVIRSSANSWNYTSPNNALEITLLTNTDSHVTAAAMNATVYDRFGAPHALALALHSASASAITLRSAAGAATPFGTVRWSASDATQSATYDPSSFTFTSATGLTLDGTVPAPGDAARSVFYIAQYRSAFWYAATQLAPFAGTTRFSILNADPNPYLPLVSYTTAPLPAPAPGSLINFRLGLAGADSAPARTAPIHGLTAAQPNNYCAREFRWTDFVSGDSYNVCNTVVDGAFDTRCTVNSEASSFALLNDAGVVGAAAAGSTTFTASTALHASAFLPGTFVTYAANQHPNAPAGVAVVAVDSTTGAVTLSAPLSSSVAATQLLPEIWIDAPGASASATALNDGALYLNVGSVFVDRSALNVAGSLDGLHVVAISGAAITLSAPLPAGAVSNRRVTIAAPAAAKSDATAYSTTSLTSANWYGDSVTPTAFIQPLPAGPTNLVEAGKTVSIQLQLNDSAYPYIAGDPAAGSFVASLRTLNSRANSVSLTFTLYNRYANTLTYRANNNGVGAVALDASSLLITARPLPADICAQTVASVPAASAFAIAPASDLRYAPTVVSAIALASSSGTQFIASGQTLTETVTFSGAVDAAITSLVGTLGAPAVNQITLYPDQDINARIFVGAVVAPVAPLPVLAPCTAYARVTAFDSGARVITLDRPVASTASPFPQCTLLVSSSIISPTGPDWGAIKINFTNGSSNATVTAGRGFLRGDDRVYSRFLTGGVANVTFYVPATGDIYFDVNANATVTGALVLVNTVSVNVTNGSNVLRVAAGSTFVRAGTRLYSTSSLPAPFNSTGALVARAGPRLTLALNASATSAAAALPVDCSAAPVSITFTSGSANVALNSYTFLTVGATVTSALYLPAPATVLAIDTHYNTATLSVNASAAGTDANVAVSVTAETTAASSTVFVYGGTLRVGWSLLASAHTPATTVANYVDFTAALETGANATTTSLYLIFGIAPDISLPRTFYSTADPPTALTVYTRATDFDTFPNAYSLQFVKTWP